MLFFLYVYIYKCVYTHLICVYIKFTLIDLIPVQHRVHYNFPLFLHVCFPSPVVRNSVLILLNIWTNLQSSCLYGSGIIRSIYLIFAPAPDIELVNFLEFPE